MRKMFFASVLLATAVSCGGNGTGIFETKMYEWADSSRYSNMRLNVEMPVIHSEADAVIAQEVIDMAVAQMFRQMNQEAEFRAAPKGLDIDGLKDCFAGYYAQIDSMAKSDYDMRVGYIESDSTLSDEDKAQMLEYAPEWTLEFNVRKLVDEPAYCVFSSRNYIYLGGAHGGVTGEGEVTFSRKDGHRIAGIVRSDCVGAIQPLLRKGLVDYFNENGDETTDENLNGLLFIGSDELIPLPSSEPYPSAAGITFVYNQYEIAPYAMGMPEFTIPWNQISPFLSDTLFSEAGEHCAEQEVG